MFIILPQISHCSQAAQEVTASVRASMNACVRNAFYQIWVRDRVRGWVTGLERC
jgi:hypothetical protein